ncbi:MAG: MYG1 family protein [Polyangiales bacterium]
MTLVVATHNGQFHADDVTAVALVRTFLDPGARIVRTRDPRLLDEADVVVDVGSVYDPSRRRFDHHQADYRGELSSAGMVLGALESEGRITPALARRLREELVDYVDAVDTGRSKPERGRPCLPSIVGMIGDQAKTFAEHDRLFERAVELVVEIVRGLVAAERKTEEAKAALEGAMAEAVKMGRRVVLLDRHHSWKEAYFALGGASHPTDFVVFPGESDVRVVAIPPEPGSFGQKRPLPAAWAGLENEALSEATGVPGSVFCHKNRFIAVFRTPEAAERALRGAGLWDA